MVMKIYSKDGGSTCLWNTGNPMWHYMVL